MWVLSVVEMTRFSLFEGPGVNKEVTRVLQQQEHRCFVFNLPSRMLTRYQDKF